MKVLRRNTSKLFAIVIISVSLFVINDAFATSRGVNSEELYKISHQVNEYSNYVHFQPEWNSYPGNLIVDVSTSWERQIIYGEEQKPDISKHGAKQKTNTLQYVNDKPLIAVSYDYMDCQSQWFHYLKTSLDFFDSRFGLFMDNDRFVYNTSYSDELQKIKLESGFAQFVPICTLQESTDYDYTVSINDDTIGFDVYFVPSEIQKLNYFDETKFEYYTQEGCFGNNFVKFSGTCKGVDKDSGLLVVIPDDLSRPLTKISIKLTEKT